MTEPGTRASLHIPGTYVEGMPVTLLIVLLALLTAVFVGLGFVVKWLFVLAIVFALAWAISMFAHGMGHRSS